MQDDLKTKDDDDETKSPKRFSTGNFILQEGVRHAHQ